MWSLPIFAGALAIAGAQPPSPSPDGPPAVALARVPGSGIQPQVSVQGDGTVHLLYFAGEPEAGDLFYARRGPIEADFSAPVRVSSEAGSAVAVGTIRGGQIALGKDNRVHVVWNGSGADGEGNRSHEDTPLLYSRLDAATGKFEPQRNLMTRTKTLDGGGTVAADRYGNVTIAWHAMDRDATVEGEAMRRVYITRSMDDGGTFPAETPVADASPGVCGCCGMAGTADSGGRVLLLYRAAKNGLARPMVLLRGDRADKEKGPVFRSTDVQDWNSSTCPMSSESLAEDKGGDTWLAWETKGQVWMARCGAADGALSAPVSPPGEGGTRKHPRLAVDSRGEVLLVWTEGTAWKRGGALAWQVFTAEGEAIAGAAGRADGVPVWSFAAAIARADGGFEILY